MGINTAQYIQIAFFALIAMCLLGIFNRKQVVINLEQNSGLSGWLYPAAFCFTFVLGYFSYTSFNLIESIFIRETSQAFFDINNPEYGGIAAQYMQIELAINIAFALSVSYLVYTFLCKQSRFKNMYLGLHTLVLAYLILAQTAWLFIPEFNQFNIVALIEIAVVAIGAIVWMPYMLKSKRVAVTFVH